MEIQSIQLEGLKAFQFSNIENLEVGINKPITILLGSNGSGKSSFLNELNPFPASRPDYEKDGKKIIHLHHNNKSYVLSSDFKNKSAPHSFKVDDVELNQSGVTGVQQELVTKYLGYNSYIRDLTYMQIDICKLGPSERKNLFLSINPIDLSLILDKHKKVCSKIKEFKNNLSMLHSRKTEIEAKLVTPSILEATYKNKDELLNQNSLLDKMIYGLSQHIARLREDHKDQIDDYTEKLHRGERILPKDDIVAFCKSLHRRLPKYTSVNRAGYTEELYRLKVGIETIEYSLSALGKSALELKQEIDEYTTHIEKTKSTSSVSMMTELTNLKNAISKLQVMDHLPIYSDKEIEQVEQLLVGRFKEQCMFFLNKEVTLWTPAIATRCFDIVKQLEYSSNGSTLKVNELQVKLENIKQDLSVISATVPDDCTLNHCKLKAGYEDKRTFLLQQQKHFTAQLELALVESKKLQKKYDKLAIKCGEQLPYRQAFLDILTHRNNYSAIYKAFTEEELFSALQIDPTGILRKLRDGVQNTKNHIAKLQYTEKANLLTKELEVLAKSSQTSIEFMTTMLTEKSNKLNSILGEMASIERTYTEHVGRIKTLDEFTELKSDLIKYKDIFDIGSSTILVLKTIEFHEKILHGCEEVKQDVLQQLRDIDLILKEQESLLSRYTEEILKWIEKLDNEKWKYELMEKSLSPTDGIPHKYTVAYLNNLIHNVNYFISRVFSYKLQLLPISTESSLNFTFPTEVEDVLVRDIGKLSRGQKEMVNLAWTFAILVQMKMLHVFPIIMDEIGSGLDPHHSQKLIEFIHDLIDKKVLNQIFLVNHEAIVSSGFTNADVVCLRTDNVLLPDEYNTHVRINV